MRVLNKEEELTFERRVLYGRRVISKYKSKYSFMRIFIVNLSCEFSLLISPLHRYKCRPYFGIYLHMLFLSFLLVELVRMVKVCAISFKICMRLGLARKKNNICLVIARKSFLLNCGFYGKRGNSDLALAGH